MRYGRKLATIALAARIAACLLPGVGQCPCLPDVFDAAGDMTEQVYDQSEWRESVERTLDVQALRSVATTTLLVK